MYRSLGFLVTEGTENRPLELACPEFPVDHGVRDHFHRPCLDEGVLQLLLASKKIETVVFYVTVLSKVWEFLPK